MGLALTLHSLQILQYLGRGPATLYSLAGAISRTSGSLHSLLARMVDEGWLERREEPAPRFTDEVPRIFYHLTPIGRLKARDSLGKLGAPVDRDPLPVLGRRGTAGLRYAVGSAALAST